MVLVFASAGGYNCRMDENRLAHLAARLSESCIREDKQLMTAESCTGGWIAKICTDLPGSSRWFEQGFVTYSNHAKQTMLGVSAATLAEHGAVSEAVVREMTAGALERGCGNLVVAVSGIAGPGGGTHFKPVGTAWLAWQQAGSAAVSMRCQFDGDRDAVRFQAVERALQGLVDLVQG
jgi:nicotinamide-nucleotide amidase